MKLEITQIQHSPDRSNTTVFLKGCPLHCPWCQTPENRKPKKELIYRPECCVGCMECFPVCHADAHDFAGGHHVIDRSRCVGCMICADVCPTGALEPSSRSVSVASILQQVQGNLTVSGGEPTVHHDELIALLQEAKSRGLETCVETTGVFYPSQIPALLACTDLFAFRIMDTDAARMKKNTGAKLEAILSNLHRIDEAGGNTILRCILIPDVNLNEAHARSIASLFQSLSNCRGVELFPYRPYGQQKWSELGLSAPGYNEPSKAELDGFIQSLVQHDIPVSLMP